MTTLQQAAQQALKCIERLNAHGWILADYEDEVYAAITALREALAQDKLRGLENLLEKSIKALRTALAQPEQEPSCPTCEALARTVMLDQTSHDQFKLDWDAMDVMVEKKQYMAKRILELEALLERQTTLLERQTARIVDLQTHIENFDGEDR